MLNTSIQQKSSSIVGKLNQSQWNQGGDRNQPYQLEQAEPAKADKLSPQEEKLQENGMPPIKTF